MRSLVTKLLCRLELGMTPGESDLTHVYYFIIEETLSAGSKNIQLQNASIEHFSKSNE